MLSHLKSLEKSCYVGDLDVESARAFTKEAFQAVGGYDASLLFGEDRDLHLRVAERYPIGRTGARAYHDTSGLSLSSDLSKSFRYGASLKKFASKHKADSRSWLSMRQFFMIRYRRTLLKDPAGAAGLTFLKLLEYLAGAAGYLSRLVQ